MHGRRKTHLGANASMRPAFHQAARRRCPSTSQVAAVKTATWHLKHAQISGDSCRLCPSMPGLCEGEDTKEEKTDVV